MGFVSGVRYDSCRSCFGKGYIIFEATISFLGVGPRGVVSWGKMVQEGRGSLDLHPWLTVFAGGAIALVVVAFNFLGDAVRDVLDPRLRGR